DQGAGQGAGAAWDPRQLRRTGPHRRDGVPRTIHATRCVRKRRERRAPRARRNAGGSGDCRRLPCLAGQLVSDRRDHRDQWRDEHAMKINGLRWLIVGLIFLATVINYIDRQTVSVLKTSISHDLGLSNADYAAVQNSFLLFYGISQMVSGRL